MTSPISNALRTSVSGNSSQLSQLVSSFCARAESDLTIMLTGRSLDLFDAVLCSVCDAHGVTVRAHITMPLGERLYRMPELQSLANRIGELSLRSEPTRELIIVDKQEALVLERDRVGGTDGQASAVSRRTVGVFLTDPVAVQTMWSLATTAFENRTVLGRHMGRASVSSETAQADEATFTLMDLEVLRQLATGATDARSANLMGISVRTYRRHVAAILDTLGVRNRFQAAIAAREMHLI